METQRTICIDANSETTIHIEKPRLGLPVSLIVDDGVPCINPLYYFYLHVNPEKLETQKHEPCIPLDLVEQFAEMAQRHAMRGKFTVLPYPAGLGTILDGWDGCDRREMERWLEITRARIAPYFDITPEILTHTLALDLQSKTLIPEAEHLWMVDRTQEELTAYMSASVDLLRQAGFAPTGVTQPCFFKGDRDLYAQAVLSALRPDHDDPDGTVVFYFIDFQMDKPPVPPHPIVALGQGKGEAVVSILTYADDYFWNTQFPAAGWSGLQGADKLITTDGQSGRLAELIRADTWTVFVTHWQSIYSNGSRQGLIGLDEVASRLARAFGPRLMWMTNGEIARYRVAEETTLITVLDQATIQLEADFACPDFTFTIKSTGIGTEHINAVEVAQQERTRSLTPDEASDRQMSSASWRQVGDHITVCFDLQRGVQTLLLRK